MKKLTLITASFVALCLTANGQVNPHAIGVRLDQGDLFSAEFSYQHGLSERNRLELDAGAGFSGNSTRVYVVGAFHWDWNIVHGFNWFVGPAVTAGVYTFTNRSDYVNVGAGGQIGFEYDFNKLDVPLLVSIDTRPIYDFLGHSPGIWVGASVGVRYTF